MTASEVPAPEEFESELTPQCRDLLWLYLGRSTEAQHAHLWLMAATTPAAAMLRAEVAARTERRALLLFNELRSAIIRSRRGGFDPMVIVSPHEFKGRADRDCEVCNLADRAPIHDVQPG
jgi:hypothetical protein